MKRTIRIIWLITGTVAVLIGLFLAWVSFSVYKPAVMEEIMANNRNSRVIMQGASLQFVSWNIGYAGLGSEMDFFYDGGKKVRAEKALTDQYLKGILAFIRQQRDIDFWLLQEVDFDAKRSYRTDQSACLADVLPDYSYSTVINYKVSFVPVPVYRPMGHVKAGMMLLANYAETAGYRHAYPRISKWPQSLFLLNRCFTESRYPLPGGKELIVFNTHNSAFVGNQALMNQELEAIRERMLTHYDNGNYVVAGGDWNMNPPGFLPADGYGGHRFVPSAVSVPVGFFPANWQFIFDDKRPTNRHLHQSYIKGQTGTTTLDFFLVSPNVRVVEKKVFDLDFTDSDHNPVLMTVVLE